MAFVLFNVMGKKKNVDSMSVPTFDVGGGGAFPGLKFKNLGTSGIAETCALAHVELL